MNRTISQPPEAPSSDWKRRLVRLRKLLKRPQKTIAEDLEVTQSEVSRWESGERPLPDSARKYIENEERKLKGRLPELRQDVFAEEFCYKAATFRKVWDDARKRIRRLSASAVIRPSSSDSPGLADAEMTIRFEGVRLPPNDPLYLDCLGVVPTLRRDGTRVCFDVTEGSELVWHGRTAPTGDAPPLLGTVDEVPSARESIGPFALAYQLCNVLEDDLIEIRFTALRGVRTNQIDAIGVPVYGDCPVESVSLSVTFDGLIPMPTPSAQYYLLRRTLSDSRPIHLAGGLQVAEGKHQFSFSNLLYPRPGFGFCIAWGSLRSSQKLTA